MHVRLDDDGRWESEDGIAWVLVEPSEAWLARHGGDDDDEPDDDV